ncbi:type II toxin-antitoxin system HicB family antitoxin [Hyphomonadaceae bacterium ML37]|nr:type II toxin-antitoxin system HicB family antitoxin [Hyphomonadaceae bacterium ML37]
MAEYIALIHKDDDSDFGVSFPDFPGCIAAGATLDKARAMAQEALAFHVEGLLEDGWAMPEPSNLSGMTGAKIGNGLAVYITLQAGST